MGKLKHRIYTKTAKNILSQHFRMQNGPNGMDYFSNDMGDISMDNLYPALVQCFAVIISGYIAGRLGVLPQSETKGLNTFVGHFCLPCLIFLSIAELDLSSVNWTFLLAILIAKAVVFFGVCTITLLVSRPVKLSRAGLFAIFCTQSNDFAIGYPIVAALYEKSHPSYPSYLYLMAPISLVILNPIGFILMELGRNENSAIGGSENIGPELQTTPIYQQRLKILARVTKGIILNPVVFMTALGIIGNIVCDHQLPVFLSGVLKVFGSAFSATALFLLGVRMVGKVHKLQGAALIVPGLLIVIKLLVLPVIAREIVSVLHSGVNSEDTEDLSTYGFLYGTFPSAPGVFVFATQYAVEVDLIASAMVACTFISAPLMFVSAKMITLPSLLPADYIKQLNAFSFDLAIASCLACVWLMCAFVVCKKMKRLPHRITCCLLMSQILANLGVILCETQSKDKLWVTHLQFALFGIGDMSFHLWGGFLALGLLLLQSRSLCLVMRLFPIFALLAWGVPAVIVLVFILYGTPSNHDPYDSPYFSSTYGRVQITATLSVLIVSFVLTMISLIFHQRYLRRYARYLLLVRDVNDQDNRPTQAALIETTDSNFDPGANNSINSTAQVTDIEDIAPDNRRILQGVRSNSNRSPPCPGDLCPASFECDSARRAVCHRLVEDYHNQLREDEEDRQTQRHIVALMLLCCSMFLSLAVCTWRLVMDELTGIYVELAFLDVSFGQGQGIILLAIFGLHSKAMIMPLINRWKELWNGPENDIPLPTWDKLEFETRHVCDQFIIHHMESCKASIARDKSERYWTKQTIDFIGEKIRIPRWRFRTHKLCFRGSELVDWLLRSDLISSRGEALSYCNHLILGRVIRHVQGCKEFQDGPALYTFSPSCQTVESASTSES